MTPGSGHWAMWPEQPLLVPRILGVRLAVYLAGWWRFVRSGRPEPLRLLAFVAGVNVLVLALASPLHHVASDYLFSAHMVQHVMVGDIAPLLLVLGVSGPLTAIVPGWLLRLAGPRWLAFVVWTAVTAGWYVPALFERALSTPWLHVLMQASVLFGGLMAWAHIVGIAPRRASAAGRAGFAFALMAAGMVVSQWLFLSGPLYDVYIDQPDRLLGLTPTADQTKAALIMGSEGMITMITAAALLMWAHVDRAAGQADVTSSPPCAPPGSSR
ncbi:MAG TPA: cytochrome c oxidase assembly protein [Miltoncostaeaceae bacterium]|nr:cytochrome c oxidase assembly protein [Miltoncostaeaceae bacterium]